MATWVHGGLLSFAVGDEDLRKDSDTQCEGLARALDQTYKILGSKLPLGIYHQQDNCIREGNTNYIARFMAGLVLIGVVRWSVLSYLRNGHSQLVKFHKSNHEGPSQPYFYKPTLHL